ncbi:uncharacterized protein RHO17_018927 [Thomomys bottae]
MDAPVPALQWGPGAPSRRPPRPRRGGGGWRPRGGGSGRRERGGRDGGERGGGAGGGDGRAASERLQLLPASRGLQAAGGRRAERSAAEPREAAGVPAERAGGRAPRVSAPRRRREDGRAPQVVGVLRPGKVSPAAACGVGAGSAAAGRVCPEITNFCSATYRSLSTVDQKGQRPAERWAGTP